MNLGNINLSFWGWWVLALIFIGLEILAPGVFFLWLGIAAAVVGLVLLIFSGLSLAGQFVLFAVLSVVSVVVGRHIYRKWRAGDIEGSPLNERTRHYIGHVFTLVQAMENGEGKIKIGDSTWIVAGPFMAAVGDAVRVIEVDGVVLRVEKA